jgi:hypothetical protein
LLRKYDATSKKLRLFLLIFIGKSAFGKLKLLLNKEKLYKFWELNKVEIEQSTKFFDEPLLIKKPSKDPI